MFKGKETRYSAEKLIAWKEGIIVRYGQSMIRILKSGQIGRVIPVTPYVELKKNDMVFCKVAGHYYLHKIVSIKGSQYQIGNNHGYVIWMDKSPRHLWQSS